MYKQYRTVQFHIDICNVFRAIATNMDSESDPINHDALYDIAYGIGISFLDSTLLA